MRVSATPQLALGDAVARRRHELTLTQEELANAVGLSERTISGIERGHANPTWHVVAAIARGLRWSVSDLAHSVEQLEAEHHYPTILLA